MSRYRHLLFDLDNTLWNFTANSHAALFDVYTTYQLDKFYPGFDAYFAQFEEHNTALWRLYGADKITKEFLSTERFLSPLRQFGILNEPLAKEMSAFYLDQCCKKTEVMPHALETLDYLKTRYTLHIVSNGFTEVQYRKLERSGLDTYFTHVFLSEETGFHKPKPEFFDHVFSKIDATKEESLMIGDNYEADIEGAMNFGIDQVFYSLNPSDTPQRTPTYRIQDLAELRLFL